MKNKEDSKRKKRGGNGKRKEGDKITLKIFVGQEVLCGPDVSAVRT